MGFITLACFMPCVVTSAHVHVGKTSETTWTMFVPKLIFWKGHSNEYMILSNKRMQQGGKILQICSYTTEDRYNRLM